MIRIVFAAKLLLDVIAVLATVKSGEYAWSVVFGGMTVADAGTVWLLTSG